MKTCFFLILSLPFKGTWQWLLWGRSLPIHPQRSADRRYAIITSNESDSYCYVLQIPKYFKNIPVGYASATAFQWSSSNAAFKIAAGSLLLTRRIT